MEQSNEIEREISDEAWEMAKKRAKERDERMLRWLRGQKLEGELAEDRDWFAATIENRSKDYPCFHCGELFFGGYYVRDEVWQAACPPAQKPLNFLHGGLLHLGCLEQRLGRNLTIEDFPAEFPINQSVRFGLARGAAIDPSAAKET